MRTFLDRIDQRRQLAQFLAPRSSEQVLRAYGPRDSGKTTFLRYASIQADHKALIWASGISMFRCSARTKVPLALLTEFILSLSRDGRTREAFSTDKFDSTGAGLRLAAFVASVTKDFSMPATSEKLEKLATQGTLPEAVGDLVARTSEWTLLRDFCVQILKEKGDEELHILIDDIDQADEESLKIILSAVYALRDHHVKIICSLTNDKEFPNHELFDDFFTSSMIDVKLGALTEKEFCQVFNEIKSGIAANVLRSLHNMIGGDVGQLQKLSQMTEFEIESFVNENISFAPEVIELPFDGGLKLSESELYSLLEVFAVRIAIGNDISIELIEALDDGRLVDRSSQIPARKQILRSLQPLVNGMHVSVMQGYVFFEQRFVSWIKHHFEKTGKKEETLNKVGVRILQEIGPQILLRNPYLQMQSIVALTHTEEFLKLLLETVSNESLDQVSTIELCRSIGHILSSERLSASCDEASLIAALEECILLADSHSNFQTASMLVKKRPLNIFRLDAILAGIRGLREVGEMRSWTDSQMEDLQGALNKKAKNVEDQLTIYSLLSSIFEHRGEYEKIEQAYEKGDLIEEQLPSSNPVRILYNLNRGLAVYHGDLITHTESLRANIESSSTTNEQSDIMLAIQANHLGMGHFYNGSYNEALSCFEETLAFTKKLGRRTETPLNNLGACHLMLGSPDVAQKLLGRARDMISIPKYQQQTITLNLCLANFLLGLEDQAIDMARPYVNNEIETPDLSLPNKFSINLGYFLMHRDEWSEANRCYSAPATFQYRFMNDEQQSTYSKLQHYTAVKAGYIPGSTLTDYDFLFLKPHEGRIFEKPFIVDINSLYVF